MAVGKLSRVDNTNRKFGSDLWYWFVKAQAKGRGEAGEEYWLVTENEAVEFAQRAVDNPEDVSRSRRGVFERVVNKGRKFGSATEYVAINVEANGVTQPWLLTEADLETLRDRTDTNAEDIAANKESWLADLFD